MLTEPQHCKVLQYSTLPLLVPAYFHALENAVVRKLLLLIGLCTGDVSVEWLSITTPILLSSSLRLWHDLLTSMPSFFTGCLALLAILRRASPPVGTVEGLIAHLVFRQMACVNVVSLYLNRVGPICWSVLHVCTVWGVLDPRGFLEFIETVGGGRHKENVHRLYNCWSKSIAFL